MRPIAIALLLLAVAPASIAQDKDKDKGTDSATANPIVATVRAMEQRYSKNLIGAADEMPAAKYSYKPTPDQITFGHLVMHIAQSNNGLCAAIAGEPARETKLSETDSKDVLDQGAARFLHLLRAGAGQGRRQHARPVGGALRRTHNYARRGVGPSLSRLGRSLWRGGHVSAIERSAAAQRQEAGGEISRGFHAILKS